MSNNNAKMIIKNGINKNGKNYSFIQFEVETPAGIYTSSPLFPSPLELAILKKVATPNTAPNNSIGGIYSNSDTSLDVEF